MSDEPLCALLLFGDIPEGLAAEVLGPINIPILIVIHPVATLRLRSWILLVIVIAVDTPGVGQVNQAVSIVVHPISTARRDGRWVFFATISSEPTSAVIRPIDPVVIVIVPPVRAGRGKVRVRLIFIAR